MIYLQCKGSRFCTRRDKVGVKEDVKETVIRHNSVGITRVSLECQRKEYLLSIIYQIFYE